MLLDPWDDAATLAQKLQQTGTRLVVVLGAQLWCQRCRDIRPLFEHYALRSKLSNVVYLWLDLETHIEFVGDYIPDDLPEVWAYQQGKVIHRGVLRLQEQQLVIEPAAMPAPGQATPALWDTLAQNNWASSASER